MSLVSVEEQREALRHAVFEADRRYRIVFVGRFFQGATGIVASMHRALEGLGHTVFPLEPARHKEVFDRSSGATGGYGPVFFRPEAASAIFKQFDPEVIVFCAGGVVLDEAGAQYFRDRGIVTIGLTLSDPDVQDSVIDWIDNFDYHTTNALLAYERYISEGNRNTFLMPFGIDKEYILREVPDAPELSADAICIGHATGRPDRHEVMTKLAEAIDVRVYGTGWPLPAETVSGDRLLQAAHEGTFHVNFPRTRAGFTNVKCGVFETIGVGSILCTARFAEMGRLFDYGDEIVGYDDAEDLARQLADLKSDPERLESMRRRSFSRLIHEHLYEHRWLQLFRDIGNDLRSEDSSKTPNERERLAKILDTNHGRPRNVIVSGFYGARNRGDDLLLDAISSRLMSADPNSNVIVAAVNAAEVERSSGYQAFNRKDQKDAEKFAASATATILGAGGLWHDYTIARASGVAGIVTGATVSPSHLIQLPLMTRAYGGNFHVYGMGVGPLKDEAARASVRLSGMMAQSVTLRDENSLKLLQGLTDQWQEQPIIAPDAVYALPLESEPSKVELPERFVALNVRPWGDAPEVPGQLRDWALEASEAIGMPVVAIPMQPVDEKTLLGEEGEHRNRYAAVFPSDAPIGEFIDVLERAEVVISMRLHSNLLAHRTGTQTVGFAYDPKVQSHFEELGRNNFVLDLDSSDEKRTEVFYKALEERGLPSKVKQRVARLEEKSNAALDRLVNQIISSPVQISPIHGMVHPPLQNKVTSAQNKKNKFVQKNIWPLSETVDLKTANVAGGNLLDSSKEVPFERKISTGGDRFQLDVRAPKEGDFVEWALPVSEADGGGTRVELWLKERYGEKPKFLNSMKYVILLDEEILFEHDIAKWNPRNTVWIGFKNSGAERQVKVRLVALRNLPDWNWGAATPMTVEAARILPWEVADPTGAKWGSSSPFAQREEITAQSPAKLEEPQEKTKSDLMSQNSAEDTFQIEQGSTYFEVAEDSVLRTFLKSGLQRVKSWFV